MSDRTPETVKDGQQARTEGHLQTHEPTTQALSLQCRADGQHPERVRTARDDVRRQRHVRHQRRNLGAHHQRPWSRSCAMLYMFRRPPVFPLIASTVTIVFGALTIVTKDPMWVQIKVTIFNAMFAGFLFVGLWLNRNFFQYVFEKTFHYTKEGWDTFTWSFAWFFVFTAVAERVRTSYLQGRRCLRALRLLDERHRHLDRLQARRRPADERLLRLAA